MGACDCDDQQLFPRIAPPPGASQAVKDCYLDAYQAFLAGCTLLTDCTLRAQAYGVYSGSTAVCDEEGLSAGQRTSIKARMWSEFRARVAA